MQAVKYIVNGTSHPSPYIIFGPPGNLDLYDLHEILNYQYKTFMIFKTKKQVPAKQVQLSRQFVSCAQCCPNPEY
jgi:hypothetical protein